MISKKKGKRKRNKIGLFIGTLCAVLACGAVILILLGSGMENFDNPGGKIEKWMEQVTSTRKNEKEQTEESVSQKWEQLGEALKDGDGGEYEETSAGETSRYGDILNNPDKMKEENIYIRDAVTEDEITLLFAGDILFDDSYSPMVHLQARNLGIAGVMSQDLLHLMQNADVFMINNEFPYSNRGTPLEGKQFTFRSKPENAGFLTDMGVDVVSLANNHAYDYGQEALLDTFDTLQQLHIPYVGAGQDIEEASNAVFFVVNDYKIGILSATQIERLDNPDTKGATDTTPGVFRCWNVDALLQKIEEVRQECDYLVVYIHWGTENEAEIDWAQEKQAAQIAQAGADLIVGDHPHCLQKMALVNGVPVIYSLGNFWFNSKDLDTGLLQVTLSMTGEFAPRVRFIPARQQNCETFLVAGGEKERILNEMRSLSAGITLDSDGVLVK